MIFKKKSQKVALLNWRTGLLAGVFSTLIDLKVEYI
jgi:hypothetical protein